MLQLDVWEQLYLGVLGNAWTIRQRIGGSPEVFWGID